MTRTFASLLFLMLLPALLGQGPGFGQGFGRRPIRMDPYGGGPLGGGEIVVDPAIKTAREVATRTGLEMPVWTNPPAFTKDVFTFCRVRYDKRPNGPWIPRTGGWSTDLPDSDINLSFRLQQMTSMRTDTDGRIIRLTDPELVNYPYLSASAPGALYLTDAEAASLRKHLLNGGFFLLDDFWGEDEWAVCEEMFKKVFPERHFFELPLSHPLYHGVFEIKAKYQCANVRRGIASEHGGETWEKPDAKEVHHRGIEDDHGRLMVLTLHNTDTGDGWEREGESDYYFHNFSEKIAYPLGVNIIYYVMTH